MARDRLEPCKHYICEGSCEKKRNASHSNYCQRCDKYVPRIKQHHTNQKKQKSRKMRELDIFDY